VSKELDTGVFESEDDFAQIVTVGGRAAGLEPLYDAEGDVRLLREASLRPIKSSATHPAGDSVDLHRAEYHGTPGGFTPAAFGAQGARIVR
jgi:hypothetical protein